MAQPIYPGALVRVSSTFKDAATSALVDPTSVTWRVHSPDGTETTTATGVRDSAGLYHLDVAIPNAHGTTAEGVWRVRIVSTGTGAASNETSFTVQPSGMTTP